MTQVQRILLVDGTCVFCNWLVSLILRRDRAGDFHFAHIQSELSKSLLAEHGLKPDLDTIYLVVRDTGEVSSVLVDGAAGREIWPRLFWFAWPVKLVPMILLNAFYRLFARIRYRLFGQHDTCVVPTESERLRFLS